MYLGRINMSQIILVPFFFGIMVYTFIIMNNVQFNIFRKGKYATLNLNLSENNKHVTKQIKTYVIKITTPRRHEHQKTPIDDHHTIIYVKEE
jgi:hypothetical protein